jgi:Arc/MetJ-type ribon-helix-helix transcriptional regulator
MRAKTVGFAVLDEDKERLAKLVAHYGEGNRSEFLRVAMRRLEHDMLAERFKSLQKQVRDGLQGRVLVEDEIVELVRNSARKKA